MDKQWRVWLDRPIHPDAFARLQEEAVVVGPFALPPQADHRDISELPGAHGMIISSRIRVDDALLTHAGPALRVVARPGIGVDNIDLAAATAHRVAVVNTPDAPTESTAEHTVALILGLAKRVCEVDRQLRSGTFQGIPSMAGTELAGKTLGLIGLGRIGRRVAEICQVLHMHVLAYDPYVASSQAAALGVTLVDNLNTLLETADVVSLHVPLTSETRGLIDATALRRMKCSAFLVNCSRGGIVDEEALLQALQEGIIAGAALDVFVSEPPPPDHPLLALPNVIATPHIASQTDDGRRRMGLSAVEQTLQVLHGQRPAHLLNPDVWDS
ncbi:MAG TPA: hydroxyacid dehydrogenase [Anaerolineae bacterium]|nr:hydroxyacid dehydrogenase [Anaerolineae bacterium]HIQ04954.1 hydroxyacid dehydrogenase [Anaerolineae bacterium]